MLNKVLLIGNVGQDPEVRYLDGNNGNGGNAKVATIRLATSERYRDRNGEQRENTEWHSVVAWRNLADLAENFIKKGTQIYVEGKIRSREYTDQTGAKKYTTEITAKVTADDLAFRIFLRGFDEKEPIVVTDLEHISMFPKDTWKGRENGMRADLAQALCDLKPGRLLKLIKHFRIQCLSGSRGMPYGAQIVLRQIDDHCVGSILIRRILLPGNRGFRLRHGFCCACRDRKHHRQSYQNGKDPFFHISLH